MIKSQATIQKSFTNLKIPAWPVTVVITFKSNQICTEEIESKSLNFEKKQSYELFDKNCEERK